jgi:hypothetical protein
MRSRACWLSVAITLVLAGVLSGAPTRTPTPTPTPTPAPKIKVKQAAVTTPTPQKKINVIKIDKSTPTPSPIKTLRRDVSTPTPTPKAIIRNYPPPPPPTATPVRIPKETVVQAPPDSKKLVPESTKPPRETVTTPKDIAAPPSTPKRLIPSTTNVSPAPPPNNAPPAPAPAPSVAPVNHTLRIFTKNGHGTLSTSLSGEFPAKLDVYANVAKDFAVQWGRDKAGTEEKGNLYITKVSSTSWLAGQSVTMPSTAQATNIQYSIPNLAPGTYELIVAGDQGNSNRVTVNFGGETSAGNSDVVVPPPSPTKPPAAPETGTITVTFTHFKPMKGTPPNSYIRPRLVYTVTATSNMTCPPINFEVDSSAFTDPSSVTSTGPASYPPLKLFEKQKKGGFKLYANTPQTHYVELDATSDFHWFLAYGKTEMATFRWSSPGLAGNSEQHPVQKAWP